MGEVTKIQWTDHTFNPWVGCTKVAPGCANCYAEADMDKRRHFAQWGPAGTRVKTSAANWDNPRKWNDAAASDGIRRRVFCSSLADIFEDWTGQPQLANGQWVVNRHEWGRVKDLVGCNLRGGNDAATLDDLRRELFRLIDHTPWLDWQLLTKRPENIRRMWHNHIATFDQDEAHIEGTIHRSNIWLGTSISDQATADKAIPHLLACRDLAPVLFLSAEPLLGPIDLSRVKPFSGECFCQDSPMGCKPRQSVGCPESAIDWVIIGGESGPQARPCEAKWIRDLHWQCRDAGVACFVKQLGTAPRPSYLPSDLCIRGIRDKKGGDPAEWPEDLRVREFPRIQIQ